jgi:hypothetical protein
MNFPKITRKSAIVMIAVATIMFTGVYLFTHRQEAFVNQWFSEFKQVDGYAKAQALQESGKAFARTFKSGEWLVATCEHSCCSGAGYDATIIRDSTGAIYVNTEHCYCGMSEEMSATFSEVKADSLATFYPQLKELNLTRR